MNDKANDFKYYQSICYMLEKLVCICLPYLNIPCTCLASLVILSQFTPIIIGFIQ